MEACAPSKNEPALPDERSGEQPDYVNANPEIAAAVPGVLPLVASLRERTAARLECHECELEARLGRLTRSGFRAGVSHAFWWSACVRLESWHGWSDVRDWSEQHIYHYDIPLNAATEAASDPRRAVAKTAVRTTVSYEGGRQRAEHIRKTAVSRADFVCVPERGASSSASARCAVAVDPSPSTAAGCEARGWDVRVALSTEEGVPDERLPPAVTPTRVAIRQRKTFVYDDTWAFDLSMVWAGATCSEAVRLQTTVPPEFHIECELLHPAARMSGIDDRYLAASLLMKMVDFLDEFRPFRLAPVSPHGKADSDAQRLDGR